MTDSWQVWRWRRKGGGTAAVVNAPRPVARRRLTANCSLTQPVITHTQGPASSHSCYRQDIDLRLSACDQLHAYAPLLISLLPAACFHLHSGERRNAYDARMLPRHYIRNVGPSSFSPVFWNTL